MIFNSMNLFSILLLGLFFQSFAIGTSAVIASEESRLIQLLATKECRQCELASSDLVHSDLTRVDLHGAILINANLNNSNLDYADLSQSDLTSASLNGASLIGANLKGAILNSTDLRNANLTDASYDKGALSNTLWSNAIGIKHELLTYRELHNAGSEYIAINNFPKAEYFFNLAINKNPTLSDSYLALAFTNLKLGKITQAIVSLNRAKNNYDLRQDDLLVTEISLLIDVLSQETSKKPLGNGLGSKILSSAISSLSIFANPLFNLPQPKVSVSY